MAAFFYYTGFMAEISISSFDDETARERGRLMAAQAVANNPDQKKKGEALFGVDYMKRRYPEAYAKPSLFGRILDKFKDAILVKEA